MRAQAIKDLPTHDISKFFQTTLVWENFQTSLLCKSLIALAFMRLPIQIFSLSLKTNLTLITASCCVEDECLWYLVTSTVTNHPLHSIYNSPMMAILQPSHEPPPRFPGTCHTKLTVEMGREGEVEICQWID